MLLPNVVFVLRSSHSTTSTETFQCPVISTSEGRLVGVCQGGRTQAICRSKPAPQHLLEFVEVFFIPELRSSRYKLYSDNSLSHTTTMFFSGTDPVPNLLLTVLRFPFFVLRSSFTVSLDMIEHCRCDSIHAKTFTSSSNNAFLVLPLVCNTDYVL